MALRKFLASDVFDQASCHYGWKWSWYVTRQEPELWFSDGWKEIKYPLTGTDILDGEEAWEIIKFVKGEFKRMWREGALRGVNNG